MDDPLPREGIYYQPVPPQETSTANKEELKKAEEALPFVDGVSVWFETAIENTNRIDLVIEEAQRRKVSIEVAVQAYDIVREILMQKKGEFDSLKLTFKQ